MSPAGYHELKSEALLHNDVKALRAEIIKFLLAPSPAGRGSSIKDALAYLTKQFHAASVEFYIFEWRPYEVGANEHHLNSWDLIIREMRDGETPPCFPTTTRCAYPYGHLKANHHLSSLSFSPLFRQSHRGIRETWTASPQQRVQRSREPRIRRILQVQEESRPGGILHGRFTQAGGACPCLRRYHESRLPGLERVEGRLPRLFGASPLLNYGHGRPVPPCL
ncbi:hypothetical protein V8F20_010846 [Naviculisporaceae sp. PSN 640]